MVSSQVADDIMYVATYSMFTELGLVLQGRNQSQPYLDSNQEYYDDVQDDRPPASEQRWDRSDQFLSNIRKTIGDLESSFEQ